MWVRVRSCSSTMVRVRIITNDALSNNLSPSTILVSCSHVCPLSHIYPLKNTCTITMNTTQHIHVYTLTLVHVLTIYSGPSFIRTSFIRRIGLSGHQISRDSYLHISHLALVVNNNNRYTYLNSQQISNSC